MSVPNSEKRSTPGVLSSYNYQLGPRSAPVFFSFSFLQFRFCSDFLFSHVPSSPLHGPARHVTLPLRSCWLSPRIRAAATSGLIPGVPEAWSVSVASRLETPIVKEKEKPGAPTGSGAATLRTFADEQQTCKPNNGRTPTACFPASVPGWGGVPAPLILGVSPRLCPGRFATRFTPLRHRNLPPRPHPGSSPPPGEVLPRLPRKHIMQKPASRGPFKGWTFPDPPRPDRPLLHRRPSRTLRPPRGLGRASPARVSPAPRHPRLCSERCFAHGGIHTRTQGRRRRHLARHLLTRRPSRVSRQHRGAGARGAHRPRRGGRG